MKWFWRPLAIAFAAVAMASVTAIQTAPAHAQAVDFDISVSYHYSEDRDSEFGWGPVLTVSNHGQQDAYGVVVRVQHEHLSSTGDDGTSYTYLGDAPTLGYTDPANQVWYVGTLPARGAAQVEHDSIAQGLGTGVALLVRYEATVTLEAPAEPRANQRNNEAEIWAYPRVDLEAAPAYALTGTLDNRFPGEGGTVTFNFSIPKGRDYGEPDATSAATGAMDGRVKISLPPSLEFVSATPSAGRFDRSASVWAVGYVGTLTPTLELVARRTLGSDLDGQCLNAELTAVPPEPPRTNPELMGDNRVRLCLGETPPTLFDTGEVQTFTAFPCVGIADHPCDDTDDVRVRAVDATTSFERVMAPGAALILVDDGRGRIFDGTVISDALQSVNSGSTVSWQTSVKEDDHGHGSGFEFDGISQGISHGVRIAYSRVPFDDHLADWTNMRRVYVVEGIDGGDPPGKMHIRSPVNGWTLHDLTAANAWTDSSSNFALTSSHETPTLWFAEFEELGTYVLEYTVQFTHVSESGDCDTDDDGSNDAFCGSDTFIFHVGPAAELAVHDGGPSPHAASSQQAFNLVVVNNGPDDAAAAQVDLELPPGTTVVGTVPPNLGTFNPGPNPTWTWDIGALSNEEDLRARGLRQDSVTLIVAGIEVGATATATISHDPYRVCIGSDGSDVDAADQAACEAVTGANWHTGTVFDYITDNNTATLVAQAGTGTVPPGVPALQSAQGDPAVVVVEWAPVVELNGWPVIHYQVWRAASDWQMVADYVTDTRYLDGDVPPGSSPRYRVRAVNTPGAAGPWSEVMVGRTTETDQPTRTIRIRPFGPQRVTATAVGTDRIELSWTGPSQLYQATVDYYEVEVSEDGRYWATLVPETVETGYTHQGLAGGSTRHYRVYAHNEEGRSLASAPARATTEAPAIPAVILPPTDLRASADGPTRIVLTWTAPDQTQGLPAEYYEVETSEDRAAWATLASDITGTTYVHGGLPPDAKVYYRVYAHHQSAGRSVASEVTCGRTSAGGLTAPCLLSAQVEGDAVTLSWTQAAGADGQLVALASRPDYTFYGLEDLGKERDTHTFTDLPPGEYLALVVAYTGTPEDPTEYRYDTAVVTVD